MDRRKTSEREITMPGNQEARSMRGLAATRVERTCCGWWRSVDADRRHEASDKPGAQYHTNPEDWVT